MLRVWPLRRDALVLLTKGGVLLLIVWSALGVLYMWLLDDGPVGDADRSMVHWLVDRRTDGLDVLADIGSGLSDTVVKLVLLVVVGGAMVITWRRWHDATFVATAVLFEASVFVLASFIVGRERPSVVRLEPDAPSGSFPSGHAAAAVAFYGAVMIVGRWHTRNRAIRSALIAIAIVVPIVVAVARVYLGMHHPLDVFSGTVLGVASLFVVHAAFTAGTAAVRAEAETEGTVLPACVTQLDCNPPDRREDPNDRAADDARRRLINATPTPDSSGRTP